MNIAFPAGATGLSYEFTFPEIPNIPPVVNAGNDIEITLPNNSASVTATASDKDGMIANVLWEQVSGKPTSIAKPNILTLTVTGLTEGEYVFKCTVTDDKGAPATDETKVTVKPAIVTPVPVDKIRGFGALATGGAGYPTVTINKLDQNTFFNACAPGNRTVVFAPGLSGTLYARLSTSNTKNLTIDGGNRITLSSKLHGGGPLEFEPGCSNIIVKNIKFDDCPGDCIGFRGKLAAFYNITFYKSGDGLLDLTVGAEWVSVFNCIFHDSTAGPSLNAYEGTKNLSWFLNALAGFERNLLIHRANNYKPTETEDLMVDFFNNAVAFKNYGTDVSYGATAMVRNNWYRTASGAVNINRFKNDNDGKAKIYMSGNLAKTGTIANLTNHAEWIIPAQYRVPLLSVADALTYIKQNAGAGNRDSRDIALLNLLG